MELPPLRDYQEECIETVSASEDLDKLIEIFCGLGKSRIMFELLQGLYRKGLKFVVMSNLNLMRQYCADYLHRRLPYMPFCTLQDTEGVHEASTDVAMAREFMEQYEDGIIAVTYHSLELLMDALGEFKPTVFFDESHNLRHEDRQWAVTDPRFAQRLYFSATPSKNNGVPMYSYSYTEALEHEDEWGQPQPFAQDVRLHVGSYVDNGAGPHDNVEFLIKTAVLTGNMRCLSFHSTVKGPDPDSVLNFAKRCKAQLPIGAPGIKWRVETLYSDMPQRDRVRILQEFDATPDDEIFILCSCETISEGVDTKRCNLVAFITPVRSYYKIVQKFGRAVRLQAHDRPATILLPFWVNPSQFTETMTKEERDAVPRTIYAKGNPLFDFYAAVREGDPELLELFQNMYRGPQTKRLKHYAELCGDRPCLSWEEAVQEATGVETDDIATAARESNTTVEVHPRDGPVEQHEGAAAVEKTIVEMEKDRFVVVPKVVAPAPRENRVVYDTCSPVLMNVNFNEALRTAVLEYEMRPEHFEQRVQEADVFYKEYGEIPKRNGKRAKETTLAHWIFNCRTKKNQDVLTLEQINLIETVLKEWWTWNPLEDSFDDKLKRLIQFYKNYGEEPTQRGMRKDERNLGVWVQVLRKSKRAGRLSEIRHARIEQECPWFKWEPTIDVIENNFRMMHEFYSSFKEIPKKKGSRKNEAFLGRWMSHQREHYKKGKLSTVIIERTTREFPWWEWSVFLSELSTKITKLHSFYEKYNDEPIAKGDRIDETILANWIQNLRMNYKNGKLPSTKIAHIEREFPNWDWGKRRNFSKTSSSEDGGDSSLDSMKFASPAEPEQQEERREKRPRDDGLDGMDKDALIAMIREKRGREGGGYTAPNPVNKDEINALFSRLLPRHRGAVLFLDHTDFKTATALQAAGVDPRDMLIPQRDRAVFQEMRRHPDFGACVVHGDFNDILLKHTMPVRGIYADFMGAFHVAEAFVQACAGLHFLPQAIVAVTISLRNPDGTDHVYQDVGRLIGLLNLHLDTVVISDSEGKTIPSMVYGNGAPMATVIQRRRN